jgi:KaiC/GvpD/RAD55 family RecA-like ATPase
MPQHPVAPRDLLLSVAQDLIIKNWQPVWCLQRQSGGFSPAEGTTGYEAPYPTVTAQPVGAHRLGFRMPPNIVCIDVDHYDGKRGADTMDRAEAWLGELPLTYKVTSRGVNDPSGRYLYRKPVELDFSDRALIQFANDNGKTDVEILRTGHRFSWAPGDINHKNGLTVQCFDPLGEPCWLPDANSEDIPELPQRWIDYLWNPPAAHSLSAYTRPGDGPQWWLLQPDASLGSDSELSAFAFDMMLSRVGMDEIFDQWLRVSRTDDPGWPWSREDFDRHVRSQAQSKAAEAIAREESTLDSLPATREQLSDIARQQSEQFEREQKLTALREQRIAEAVQGQFIFPVIPLDQEAPEQAPTQSQSEFISGLVRGLPQYDQQYKNILARKQAEIDVEYLLAAQFEGYKSIAYLPEPPEPETLRVMGKDSAQSSVIARAKVTVMSGHRSSGKTWVTATWAAQELRAGNRVIWIDFERQEDELASKLRQLGIPAHVMDSQLQYTAVLPPAPRLAADVREATENGSHRCLVVVDAFRTLQNLVVPGSTANDGDAVEQVYIEYLTPAQEAGANIVLLDHMSKAGDKGTFGSERKESAADYVIKVEKVQQFSKLSAGYSSLTVTKARGGHIDEDIVVGYLWVPGDGSISGESIRQYPKYPELRNWAPEIEATLEDVQGASEKGQKEEAIIEIVRDNRLQLGPRPLGQRVFEVCPDLFTSAKAATDFAGRMAKQGKIVKEDGQQGKYDLPAMPVVKGPAVSAADLVLPEDGGE